LVEEAAEVGGTAVAIMREVKNKGFQLGGITSMGYTAAAAHGTLAASIHDPQNAKSIPTQTKREVTVIAQV
jgi:hypothetical protein